MKLRLACALLACGLSALACGNNDAPTPEPSSKPAPVLKPPTTAGGQFAATPAKTADPAPQKVVPAIPPAAGYPLTDIKAIPDNCATPAALLATAPGSVGDNYAWNISRQALLANQQFRVTSGDPAAPGEVKLATYKYNDNAYALVATCKDGGTCNNLAAMYKAIVRSSHPQVVCGKVNGISSSPVGSGFGWSADAKQNLPNTSDKVAACARLNACQIATDRSTPGDPFLECQKAPGKFKTECADRYPCSEVLACMGK